MGKTIGIDLGTTNSVVSVIEGGEPVVITNAEGGRTTPSVVAFTDSSERLVGITAKRQAITNPKRTVSSIKRFMGRRYSEVPEEISRVPYKVSQSDGELAVVEIDGKKHTPPEISAQILQKMKQTAEDHLGQKVTQAVITVPAYFNDSQRQATKDAGRIAGLEVLRIINEPTAASLAYGLDKKIDQKIAVYDLGGGTFDISILELGDGVFEVKSTNGDTHLGGDDFDNVLIDFIAGEFKKEHGIDLRDDPMALQRLKDGAERAKCELSSAMETSIDIPFITATSSGPKHLNMKMTRAKFESLVAHLVERTVGPCRTALKDAGIDQVDEVILVGGSIRIPMVQKKVKEIFGKEPNRSVNPDEVVAVGAAIQAGVLAKEIKDVLLLDVTPLSLGIETLGDVFTKLIEKNTTIPCKRSQVFSTAADSQPAVTVKVFQGEREIASRNRLLGEFNLEGIPPAPRGLPQIEVTFDIDANGIVHVSAKDKGTGKEQKIRIESSSGLTEAEIKRMEREASEHAEEDHKYREAAEARNKADALVYSTEKSLEEYGAKLSAETKQEVQHEIDEVKRALESGDAPRIKDACAKLEKVSRKLGEAIYEEVAKQQAAAGPGGPGPEPGGPGSANAGEGKTSSGGDDNVVDAEYEVHK